MDLKGEFMAVKIIENIVNYDPEKLEKELQEVIRMEDEQDKAYLNDPEIAALRKKEDRLIYLQEMNFIIYLIGTGLLIFAGSLLLNKTGYIIIPVISILETILTGTFFDLRKKLLNQIDETEDELYSLRKQYDTVCEKENLYFHSVVGKYRLLSCYACVKGKIYADITVVMEDEENDEIIVEHGGTFSYNGSNPGGVLTFDVEKELLYYAGKLH